MDRLSNAFSLLALADEDGQTPAPATPSSPATTASSSSSSLPGNQGAKVNGPLELGEFKQPLVWIDLEMTGLNIEADRILEIACIVTDGKLTKSVEGPDLVIHQTKCCLDRMGEWCQTHHGASGLTEEVLQSTISEMEAEKQVIEFVKKHVGGSETPLLAGNSVYVDFQFLKKYMPDLAALFPHVLVDVSSVKALCKRWYPQDRRMKPAKENKHRAMDDIRGSIKELKFYKENIFKASKSRR
ncbi:PREDICTED: oligoribonuclease-like [Tarenaya hassleriana]|uniref:oligoribonuclease-like n=1 Tax=Tarenaya hassleriana TaxID=28532 RepID=UPI00053C7917|nr:PREDICTED: oligoribonuclease-like [Tarenaya hassleriana]